MREGFDRNGYSSPWMAWALAAVFIGLVAVPAFMNGSSGRHEAGVVDIGTPGAVVRVVPEWSNAVTEDDRSGVTRPDETAATPGEGASETSSSHPAM
jgi:hypothetical protein